MPHSPSSPAVTNSQDSGAWASRFTAAWRGVSWGGQSRVSPELFARFRRLGLTARISARVCGVGRGLVSAMRALPQPPLRRSPYIQANQLTPVRVLCLVDGEQADAAPGLILRVVGWRQPLRREIG